MLLAIQPPGNVVLVLVQLANIAYFSIFPVYPLYEAIFTFTATESAGTGFSTMGIDSKCVVNYLGMTFLMMIVMALQYLLYGLAFACKKYDRIMNKIEKYLRPALYNGLIYTFLRQSYFDWSMGSALRLEEPKFETGSDYFDLTLASVGGTVSLVLPFYNYFYLKRNFERLGNADF